MTKEEVREMLPKVGDHRMEVPTVLKGEGYNKEPRPCVVTYVNRLHMWYEVKFKDGTRESYKLPRNGGGQK
jgi:hypothetical protein